MEAGYSMARWGIRGVAACFALFLSACASTPPEREAVQRPADIPPPPFELANFKGEMIWGVNGHPFSAYPDISLSQQLDLTDRLGAKYYRINLGGQGTPDKLERLVRMAHSRDLLILPILQPPVSLDDDSIGKIYRVSFEYAVTYATRFKGKMPVWELENELENYAIIQPCEMLDDGTQYPCEWGPGSGTKEADYYTPRWRKVSAVLKGLADGVAAADPDALTAIGTAGWGHTGAFDRLIFDGVDWDLTVWHSYQTGEQIEWAMEKLAALGKPIWLTEFNHPGGTMAGDEEMASGLAAKMRWLLENQDKYDIQSAHIYELLDEPYWSGHESVMGLFKVERGTTGKWEVTDPKPAFYAAEEIITKKKLNSNADGAVELMN